MKILFVYAIIYQLILGPFFLQQARAEHSPVAPLAKTQTMPPPSTSSRAIHVAGEQGQALILLLALSAMFAGKELIEANSRKKQGHLSEMILEVPKILYEVSGAILSNTAIASGLAGASAAMKISQNSMRAVQSLILSKQMRPLLQIFLPALMASIVGALGFEFFRFVFMEAREMITDKESYRIAGNWPQMLRGLLIAPFSKNAQYEAEGRVLGLLLANAWTILITKPDLRALLFRNLFRSGILTGDFMTMMGTMVVAITVGNLFFPGAGAVLGLTFAFVGGIAWMLIPESTKDSVTLAIQSTERSYLRLRRSGSFFIAAEEERVFRTYALALKAGKDPTFPESSALLEKDVSISIERMVFFEKKLGRLEAIAQLQENRTEVRQKAEEAYGRARFLYIKEARKIVKVYQDSIAQLKNLAQKYDLAMTAHDSLAQRLERDQMICDYFSAFLQLIEDGTKYGQRKNQHLPILMRLQVFGFSSEVLLRSI